MTNQSAYKDMLQAEQTCSESGAEHPTVPISRKVDFAYTFAAPHRLGICMPNASHKLMIDCVPEKATLAWSYHALAEVPLGALMPVQPEWYADVTVAVDDTKLSDNRWNRLHCYLPALEYHFGHKACPVSVQMTAVSGKTADYIRFEAVNHDTVPHDYEILGSMNRNLVFSHAWMEHRGAENYVIATWGQAADRLLLVGTEPVDFARLKVRDAVQYNFVLQPGETKVCWFLRPFQAIIDDLSSLLSLDFEKEYQLGIDCWERLLQDGMRLSLPDDDIANAYYAGFCDMFVMREPQKNAKLACSAGTAGYRAANTAEPAIATILMNQAGYSDCSQEQIEFMFDLIDPKTGRMDDYRGWGHHVWFMPGFKAWAIWEHYRYTGNKKFLSRCLDKLMDHLRWAVRERETTKTPYDEAQGKPLNWGLMPRGFGDCGVTDDDDLYGVFMPHNIWHCYASKVAAIAAKELGRQADFTEASTSFDDEYDCLMHTLEKGAIVEPDGSQWIPGTAGKTCGSRWGVVNAVAPCKLLAPDHPLAVGTMKKMEGALSIGGLPVDLGWMKGGLWVAIALNDLSYYHMLNNEPQKAAAYLYPTLNHASPLLSWCEERMPEPNTPTQTGDIQHLWTPIAVARFVRDMLLHDDEDTLHITRAIPDWWLTAGQSITVKNAHTYWGTMNLQISRLAENRLSLELFGDRFISLSDGAPCRLLWSPLLPGISFEKIAGGTFTVTGAAYRVAGDKIELTPTENTIHLQVQF